MMRSFFVVAALAFTSRAQAVSVAPEDGAAGLERAIAAASAGGEVVLERGVYRLDRTLTFKADGVTVRSAEKGGAVLSGAVPVTGWQPVAGKPWLKAKAEGVGYFRSLIVNGRSAPRAEFPGKGKKLNNTNTWNVRWLSSIGNGWERAPTREELATVFVKKGDLPDDFDPASADIRVYHDWDNSLVRTDRWIPGELRLELKEPCRFPPGSFNRHGYVIYNTKEGMQEPGNWFFDAVAGDLYYWPREGETADSLRVEVPRTVRLVEFGGSRDVTFDGVVFADAMPPMQRSTFSGVGIDAAVTGKKTENCTFRDCAFRNCGGIALRFGGAGLRLEGNLFERSGSCALQADGRGLVLVGNRFLSSGCVFTSACACNVGGRDIRFVSNEIDGAPYCGVVWGGQDNLFASNTVRNVMQTLHDGAAFYGMGARTVFRGNRVFDNQPGERARHAFYFDEGGRDGLIADNYVEGGFRTCVLNHFAYNIVVSNNVFRTPGNQTISFSGSRWGTCVGNRFECGGTFERMPNAAEITNWAGNVFLEKGVRTDLSPCAVPAKANADEITVPYTAHAPGIDGWVNAADWPGTWAYAETAADGTSLHGTPRMFRACHDGTNLYLAARAPHYKWETPATNAAAAVDWVRFRFAGRELEIRADGSGVVGCRTFAGLEKTARKGMGWYMTFQAAVPLAKIGVAENGAMRADFDFAIHDTLTGETRHRDPTVENELPSTFRFDFPDRSSASGRGVDAAADETVPFKRLNGLCNTLPLKNDLNRTRFDRLKELYRALEIPETRFHDVSLENPGIELVDVSRIFPLLHADENDPRNYNFAPTDLYLARARELGGELEFRFGETIEHQQVQFQVRPPADIDKWARICLNIARHYNSGWGGGHHWNIRRFSVWEEPDNDRLLADSKKGNFERCYFRMYAAVARLIKAEWPQAHVGGPNTMGPGKKFKAFVSYCAAEKLPLDFAAYTHYCRNPLAFAQASREARKTLDELGYAGTELEISEWHLMPVTWDFSDPRYSSSILGPDSAAFSAAVLALGQEVPIDHMFYYAAHVGNWSLFEGIRPRPVYYVMRTFAELARGSRLRLPVNPANGVYTLVSRLSESTGLMMTAFYDVKAGEYSVELPTDARPREVKTVSETREPSAVGGWRIAAGRIVMKLPAGSQVYRVDLEW